MANKPKKSRYETVTHPLHYGGDTTYEAIKVIEAWNLGFHLGTVVKYIARLGKKPGVDKIEDLRKASFYLSRKIELMQAKRDKKKRRSED